MHSTRTNVYLSREKRPGAYNDLGTLNDLPRI